MSIRHALLAASVTAALWAMPAAAQDATAPTAPPPTVFDGDWATVGVGAAYAPDYTGSNDYKVSVLPVVTGKVAGIGISPRRAGLAFDLINNTGGKVDLILGPVAAVRFERSGKIKDPAVAALGKLGKAIEVGGTAGLGFSQVLNPYDKLSATVDVLKDVNGAHGGVLITPSLSYLTPLSRGIVATLSLSATHGSDKFVDYYSSVTPAGSLASGLPTFAAKGGWTSAGATLLTGVDLDGDLANGGATLFFIGGYSRQLGDTARSPIVSLRGTRSTWLVGAGIGYTF